MSQISFESIKTDLQNLTNYVKDLRKKQSVEMSKQPIELV